MLQEINDYYGDFKVNGDLLELRNLATIAQLVIASAKQRKESRGLHYTLDHTQVGDDTQPTILDPSTTQF